MAVKVTSSRLRTRPSGKFVTIFATILHAFIFFLFLSLFLKGETEQKRRGEERKKKERKSKCDHARKMQGLGLS